MPTSVTRHVQSRAHDKFADSAASHHPGLFDHCLHGAGEVRDTTDDQAFLFPRIDRAVLTVSRAGSVAEDGCSYRVSIDSHEAGSLVPKGWITMYPPAGTYVVSVHAEGGACAAALQMRTRLDVHHEQRLQIVRAANGSLRWNDEEPPWPF